MQQNIISEKGGGGIGQVMILVWRGGGGLLEPPFCADPNDILLSWKNCILLPPDCNVSKRGVSQQPWVPVSHVCLICSDGCCLLWIQLQCKNAGDCKLTRQLLFINCMHLGAETYSRKEWSFPQESNRGPCLLHAIFWPLEGFRRHPPISPV